MSMKNSNVTIGNRTRELPACSSVPQPTAPPRAPNTTGKINKKTHYIDKFIISSLLYMIRVRCFAHHQEHFTVFTVSSSVQPSCCRLAAGSSLGKYYQIL
jgi:hypothetical protein